MDGMLKAIIDGWGYIGVFLSMIMESLCLPTASETTMSFSGFLVSTGKFNIWIVIFLGTIGDLIGAVLSYGIGYYGGRPLLLKYGKYLLIVSNDIKILESWLVRQGERVVFLSRNVPIIRTFISLPAGIGRMNFLRFIACTVVGSLPWCMVLVCMGLFMGEEWKTIERIFFNFNMIVGIFLLVLLGIFIGMRLKRGNGSPDINWRGGRC
ncbi:DedA family protein [Candidatus Desantisbacteria bacterium]|nr:DedA family protein [Candidatus Desantisbacteria bacterium]